MRLLSLSACLLMLATTAASAGNFYKWKDANGVTQYSEKPPTGQKFEARRITSSGVSVPESEAENDSNESQSCKDSRRNLEMLSGKGPVMQDTDGDGKPDAPIADSQREAQKNLADAAVKAYCKPAAKS